MDPPTPGDGAPTPAPDGQAAADLASSAEAGASEAQFRLGLLLARGEGGLPRDLQQARRWCAAAAEQGHAQAQFNLGLLLADGDAAERRQAGRWLRAAALNGVAEAETCLGLFAGVRPRTWDDAETRASIALAPTGGEGGKRLRFADYYVDPCLDIIVKRFHLALHEAEDIVQQFFLEMEEPLERGRHAGRPWKESLRSSFDPGRGAFRPYLLRALSNFTLDHLRRRTARAATAPAAPEAADPEHLLDHHAEGWHAAIRAFIADASGAGAPARAVEVIRLSLEEGLAQDVICARTGVSVRTVCRDNLLGAELLGEWLERRIGEIHGGHDPRTLAALRSGLELLPHWLSHPGPDKRRRALLLLAYVERLHAPQGR
jgi:DNA-directed RNA polymerase specialized sigma24 family protein